MNTELDLLVEEIIDICLEQRRDDAHVIIWDRLIKDGIETIVNAERYKAKEHQPND